MSQVLNPSQLKEVANRIVAGLAPEKIVLFGSYAWGSPNPRSDLDLLIVHSTALPRRERRRQVSDLLRPRPAPIDIFVYTPEEIERSTQLKGSFIKEILKRGKVLYEKS